MGTQRGDGNTHNAQRDIVLWCGKKPHEKQQGEKSHAKLTREATREASREATGEVKREAMEKPQDKPTSNTQRTHENIQRTHR